MVQDNREALLAELMDVAAELQERNPEALELLVQLARKMVETAALQIPQKQT